CWELQRCIASTGCKDIRDCYRPEACMWLIDAVGGPYSADLATAFQYRECLGRSCGAACELPRATGP
ncbi:MAG: hypothetical protein FJ104_11565, partial [Deltaproteobacteria bacterium]|nr:hypothetical protein [Deltaproteobacteria bacterium]